MSTLLSQKRKVSVELEIDAYADLDVQVLRALDWHKILMLESDETVAVSVEEGEDEIDELYYSQLGFVIVKENVSNILWQDP